MQEVRIYNLVLKEIPEMMSCTSKFKIGYDAPITEPINIEVSKGDHIAVIGPNGVGKTTLIKTIAQNKTILAVASPLVQIFKLVIMIRNKQNLNRIKQF